MTDRIKSALVMAAVQAENWPAGFGNFWGLTIDGKWTQEPADVSEYG
ncbi:MAG TPA: hypothetical protein VHL09_05830 [Dehalococcoidia bacterium]|nr:hypothetical protein [Dehalococcoidia bacterium]